MRVLVLLLVAVALLFVVWSVGELWRMRHRRRRREHASWMIRTAHHDGRTRVAVGLVTPGQMLLDEQLVAEFPDLSPDWSEQFLHACETARERAFHLNTNNE